MSDLNNFQSSEAWRNNLKNFLTMKRSTEQLKENMSQNSHHPVVVDVDEDLKKLLEKQKEKSTTGDISAQQNPRQHGGWGQLSDESFEALERMCDKTVSDPNSTLFKYLHADQKDQILAKAKICNVVTDSAAPQGSKALLEKLKDCTLLDDVEAPSNFWENTMSSETLYTSPVKMVGLLRPSTIMEETLTWNDSDSQNVTAHFNNVEARQYNDRNIDDSRLCSSGTLQTEDKKNSVKLPSTSIDAPENKLIITPKCNLNSSIDLEVSSENENSPDISIIEILSDEETTEEGYANANETNDDLHKAEENNANNSNKSQPLKEDCLNNEKFLIDENDKENRFDLSSINGMHFNDTLEEVEYMMRKGEEYMTKKEEGNTDEEKKQTQAMQHNQNQPKNESKTKLKYPTTPLPKSNKLTEQQQSVISRKIVSQFKVPLSKKLPNKCIGFDVKPIPKFNLCVKPSSSNKSNTNITSNSNNKEFNKKHFSHIVSPIGTYVKKTATAPLMMDMKPRQNNNLLKSQAFRTLEYESRLHTPTDTIQNEGAVAAVGNTTGQKTLSKKAYISSGLKHIVDERSPVTIPGSKKVQKYLESAVMPAVLKHEGKIKMPDKSNYECLKRSNLPSLKPKASSNIVDNTSMADLSIMSGDLSLYTMTDARKF